jgi:cytochrome c5
LHQTHLHRAATLRHSLVSLAIRVETLLITSMREGRRPARVLALAIAMYLWSLAPEADRDETKGEGQAVFERACSGCHQEPTYTGPPVEIGAVGTDPAVAQSPSRGTGTWRVPSLLGVSDRALLTSSGAFTTLEELLDPTRRQGGHLFGLDLSEADRRSLLRHLDTL